MLLLGLQRRCLAALGTAAWIQRAGMPVQLVTKRIGKGKPDVLDVILGQVVDGVINTPGPADKEVLDGLEIRRAAVERGIPCVTSIDTARAMVTAMSQATSAYSVQTLADYRRVGRGYSVYCARNRYWADRIIATESRPRDAREGLRRMMKVMYTLLILVPIVLVLDIANIGSHSVIFTTSALAMIPLAAILGQATEQVAFYTGEKIGGLLNATLGNAAELIITIIALREGLTEVVKASIAGSILGNILFVLGASLLIGGLKNGEQTFDDKTAGVNASMLSLAVAVLIIPAVLALAPPESRPSHHDIQHLSDGMAVIMILLYALYLLYSRAASRQPV